MAPPTDNIPPKTTYISALSVTNIRTLIPLVLDFEKVQYTSWASLFRNTAKAHGVLDHIEPNTPRPYDIDDELWSRLDAIVLQWIYGTISIDLLHTILNDKATTMVAWDHLRDLFQDNKGTCAVHLENQFSSIQLENFPTTSAYCQALKNIADQLTSIGNPVSDERLVLQLVTGLSRDYDTVATFIQQSNPLPSFTKARSMLALEENQRIKQRDNTASPSTILMAASDKLNTQQQQFNNNSPEQQSFSGHRGGRGGRGNQGRGRNRGGRNSGGGRVHSQPPNQQQWAAPWNSWYGQWAFPPCPYPSLPYRPPNSSSGILGSAPRQPPTSPHAMVAPSPPPMQPTDLPGFFNAMTLQPPDDNWYMDTGASSHLTNQPGSSDTGSYDEVQ